MTDETHPNTRRAWLMTLGGATILLGTAGCVATDPYGYGPQGDSGQYPADQGSYGQYPQGQYPQGQYPQDQYPQSQPPATPPAYGQDPYGQGGDAYPSPNGGYGSAAATQPRRTSGGLEARDFPRDGAEQRNGRSATFRLDIGVDGRVQGCSATQSSGLADLDAYTCRLIQSRFAYEPARDRSGRAVQGVAGWQQSWSLPGR